MLRFTQAALKPVAILWLLAAPVICSAQDSAQGEVQTWFDDTLAHKIEAKYKGMEGNFVKLETADGQVKKIPYGKLSLSSQLKAKKLADPSSFDAPPLPSSYSAPPLSESPFKPDDTIDQFLETFTKQLKEGHADVVWHSFPPSAKADVEACIVRTAEILGPNTFKQMQVVLPNLHTIIRDKRSFIVGSPSISSQPMVAKTLNQILPAMEPLIGVLTKQTTWNSENFKEGKVGPWLMLFGNDALAASKSLGNALKTLIPNMQMPNPEDYSNYKIVEKTADTAKVEITAGKQKVVTKYKKIDGCWVSDQYEVFFAQVSRYKNHLETLDQAGRDEMKKQVRDGLTGANTLLGSLAKARTQQEFNQMFDPIASMAVRGMQNSLAAAQRGGQPGMSMNGSSEGMSGNSGGMGMSGGKLRWHGRWKFRRHVRTCRKFGRHVRTRRKFWWHGPTKTIGTQCL